MKRIFLLFLSLFICTSVFADPIKEFVVIGDSLSDNGNLYAKFLKIVPKSPPYFQGRFTNGPTWAEDVGKYYYDQYNINYKVVAYGGATAILHNPIYDKFIAPITLDGEMAEYFWGSMLTDKSKVLYAIWIGANDYLYDEQPNMDNLVKDVVDKISSSTKALIISGAKTIVILNLPDLARTPFAKSHNNGERLHTLTINHNQKLNEAIAKLQSAYPKVKIVTINIYDVFNNFLDNTTAFNQTYNVNITNTNEACWKGGMTLNQSANAKVLNAELQQAMTKQRVKINNFDATAVSNFIMSSPSLALAYNTSKAHDDGLKACSNADEHIFWDELHPTDVVHMVLSKIFVNTLQAEKLI